VKQLAKRNAPLAAKKNSQANPTRSLIGLARKKKKQRRNPPSRPAVKFADWLRDFSAPPPAAETELPQAAAESPAADLPDWLERTPSTAAPVAAETCRAGHGIPDWLKGFGAEEPPTADAGQAADIVDQFKTVKIEYPLAGMPIPPAAEAAPAEEIPDWLKRWKPRPGRRENNCRFPGDAHRPTARCIGKRRCGFGLARRFGCQARRPPEELITSPEEPINNFSRRGAAPAEEIPIG